MQYRIISRSSILQDDSADPTPPSARHAPHLLEAPPDLRQIVALRVLCVGRLERIKAMVTFRSRVVSSALLFAASTFYTLALPESTEQCMQL